ncbi:MAG: hypothetical protein KQJ78_07290 [Deltaproteobacteria bacterium]|nr:hypothetical protein [Deltaproteobacteria bacterium]
MGATSEELKEAMAVAMTVGATRIQMLQDTQQRLVDQAMPAQTAPAAAPAGLAEATEEKEAEACSA